MVYAVIMIKKNNNKYLCQVAQDATTKHYRLGDLNNRDIFSHTSGG